MTAIEKVCAMFERYAKVPLALSVRGEPLLLVQDDFNANLIVAQMRELYGESWSLQGIVDLVRDLTFAKQLHWQIQPGWAPTQEQQPTAPPTSAQPKDVRTREQKLRDAGVFVRTDKATAEDVKAQENRHAESREKLKALFTDDPKRIAFDDELRSANQIQVTTSPGIISRVKSYAAREEARKQIRLKYPRYAHLAIQPDSEALNHRPGVF
jgi:hypothetical protein